MEPAPFLGHALLELMREFRTTKRLVRHHEVSTHHITPTAAVLSLSRASSWTWAPARLRTRMEPATPVRGGVRGAGEHPQRCRHRDFDTRVGTLDMAIPKLRYYVYIFDEQMGPGFIKICAYAPYPIKVWLNGHEAVKRIAAATDLEPLSNGFAACRDPAALQGLCDQLQAGRLRVFFERWMHRLPLPLTD